MKKKKTIYIISATIVLIFVLIATTRISRPRTIIDTKTKDQANFEVLEIVINEYIKKTHSLPMWGESFTDDPRFAEFFLHPSRKIRDPWEGKYSLTLTEDGASLLIVSAGEDRAFGTKDDLKHRLNINPNQELEPTSLDAD